VDDVWVTALVCDGSSGCEPGCAEDINRDCAVDVSDLSLLLSHFGETGLGIAGDIQQDGRVDVADLAMLLAAFGIHCD
jgi:hypothetical protein